MLNSRLYPPFTDTHPGGRVFPENVGVIIVCVSSLPPRFAFANLHVSFDLIVCPFFRSVHCFVAVTTNHELLEVLHCPLPFSTAMSQNKSFEDEQYFMPQVQLLKLISLPSVEGHTGTAAHLLNEALQ